MSLSDRAKLIRLKMQMEIIRTICPMIMILIQLFIIIKIYQRPPRKSQKKTVRDDCFFCQVTTHYRIDDTRWANENDSHLASRKLNDNHSQLAFSYFLAHARQKSEKSQLRMIRIWPPGSLCVCEQVPGKKKQSSLTVFFCGFLGGRQ